MGQNGHQNEIYFYLKLMSLSEDVLRDCERFGEDEVRKKLAARAWRDPAAAGVASDWLKRKGEERAAAREAERDKREEEALLIARKALGASEASNKIARQARLDSSRANTIATVAIICSTVATIISVIVGAIISGFLGHKP
jgi:hypothetical protein